MKNIGEYIKDIDKEQARGLFQELIGKKDYSSTVAKINYLIFSRNFNSACNYCQSILHEVPLEKIKIGVFVNILRAFYFSGRDAYIQDFLVKKLYASSDKDKLIILTSVIELGHHDVTSLIQAANVKLNEHSRFFLDRVPLTNSCESLGGRDGKFLFVSGTPRSGTSAFGVLLNQSDDVALSVERYGYAQGYHPFMFSLSNLFHSNDYIKKYKSIYEKFDRASYVGDKRPNFLFSWEITKKNFSPEQIKVLHFTRDPYLVAESYHKRAKKQAEGKDSWSSNAISPRDEFYACHDINLNNQICLDILKDAEYKDSLMVVDSEKLYSSMENVMMVFDWLGIYFDDSLKNRTASMIKKSGEMKKKTYVTQDVSSTVDRMVDFKLLEDLYEFA